MLSIKNNFLFIHYHKTGGNSVEYALREHSEDKLIPHPAIKDRFGVRSRLSGMKKNIKHKRLVDFKEHLDNDVYARLFKFSIIRNPWERVLSFYLFEDFRKAWRIADRDVKQQNSELTFDRFRQDYESRQTATIDKKDFLAFVKKTSSVRLRRYIRLPPADSSDVGALDADIDYLMRYEHLEEDFAHVCKQIGIAPIVLPHLNKTKHEHYSRYYDDELVVLVAERYREEIAFGGYTFERRQDCGF